MPATNLVLLSRHLADATPTAATFAASQASRGFTDYDEGDILDDLVGPTPTLRHAPRRALVEDDDDDDDASTCSSVTAGGDNSSVSSRGRGRHSDTASVTSVSEADSSVNTVNAVKNNRKSGRLRRRRNNRAKADANAVSEAASEMGSETAYETTSVTDSVTSSVSKSRNRRRSRAKDAPVKEKSTTRQPAKKTSTEPSRNSRTLGVNTRETSTARSSKSRRTKQPQLIIGLDLDAEIELKSRVQGDICLTLVLEEEAKMKQQASPEVRIRKRGSGRIVSVEEWEDLSEEETEKESGGREKKKSSEVIRQLLPAKEAPEQDEETAGTRRGRREICHMRVAKFKLARRWWMDGFEFLGRFPPPLVLSAAAVLPVVGFAVGWLAANWQW